MCCPLKQTHYQIKYTILRKVPVCLLYIIINKYATLFEVKSKGVFIMEKKRTNKNVKVRGNGEGTIYFSEALNKYVAQYVEPSTGKRKTLTQRKNEGKKEK